uniref:Uncharacterized protein n=1 Tax=Anguilla anguilla TaxID=7936 RepID=A0A0E9QNJ7_ANGAN
MKVNAKMSHCKKQEFPTPSEILHLRIANVS